MRRIFFEEKLGETRRNSEGGASRTGRDGSCGRDGSGGSSGVRAARARMGAIGVVRIKRVSLFGNSLFILTMKNV